MFIPAIFKTHHLTVFALVFLVVAAAAGFFGFTKWKNRSPKVTLPQAYQVEYSEIFSRTIDGKNQEYVYRIVERKSGNFWRKDIYVNDTGLLEATISNQHGVFHCVPYDPMPCKKLSGLAGAEESASAAGASVLAAWEKSGFYTQTIASKTMMVGSAEFSANCTARIFDPAKFTESDVASLKTVFDYQDIASPEVADAFRSRVEAYATEVCVDSKSGIMLSSAITVRQNIPTASGDVEYQSEDNVVATNLDFNPMIASEVFAALDIK